jgi:tRNA A37 threonylcarbamoyltransferase TsaD
LITNHKYQLSFSLSIFGAFSGKVLAESIDTQRSTRFGGVIPTFAMHFHANRIQHVVERALSQARRQAFSYQTLFRKADLATVLRIRDPVPF